ncbi:hypothetical protein SODALDRAFT_332791 [Sodiomyces alkalinus F11]|uniref:Uncharacterized protein n=1 Tax=Sodiomyces alkalinus (strain CBS 110278 / VKM F-3762 / F11) TaxID=1314773 RepID=A0A3N2PY08_SODAK|nr:hypothetical protein SODALDRAFT_332791 [Sodiomyces alkalinus F11]ROT39354.1 hypothetical protein SODALDRAFT_332791 [Sodiomyces alkalinus F11]
MVSAPPSHADPVDLLTLKLQSLNVRSLEKESEREREKERERPPTRRRHAWSSIDTDSSFEPLEVIEETHEPGDSYQSSQENCNSPVDQASAFDEQVLRATGYHNSRLANDPHIRASIAKHQTGRFDYILNVPYDRPNSSPGDGGIAHYGCNLLVEKKHLGRGVYCEGRLTNVYTLLATYLADESQDQDSSRISTYDHNMAIAEPIVRVLSPPAENNIGTGGEVVDVMMTSGTSTATLVDSSSSSSWSVVEGRHAGACSTSTGESRGPSLDHSSARSTSISSSPARIEDSVEALDKLEDDLEALDAATRLGQFISPEEKKRKNTGSRIQVESDEMRASPSSKNTLRSSPSVAKAATVGVKATTTRPSLQKSASVTFSDREDKAEPATTTAQGPAERAGQKPTVTRPSSLLPPKVPAKSAKPPTRPSFELPGEAVARRLKEQREARRSLQISSHSDAPATTVPPRQRAKSTKAPTRPHFELPGEAISRRKREQREKELKEKEESEKKRREFRAQPIRAGAASATYPRETAASRARRLKATSEETTPPATTTSPSKATSTSTAKSTTNTSKRASMVVPGSSRPALAKSASTSSLSATSSVSRGRATARTAVGEMQGSRTSRGTSESTGSTSGKRSTVSAEDAQKQRQRGREIYEQDNSYAEQRERERRQREEAAKKAREEAAERSRQASREWAEKQRRKQQMSSASTASLSEPAW